MIKIDSRDGIKVLEGWYVSSRRSADLKTPLKKKE